MTTTDRLRTPSSKAGRAESTRRALLDSARSLFGERGYAGTSVDEVVRHAGLTKGALYHHFRDKDDLFRAVLEEVKRDVTSAAGATFLETAAAGDSLQTVLKGCLAMIDAYEDPAAQRIAILDARSVLDGATRRDLDARYEVALLRASFRAAMRAGAVERQPIAPLAHIFSGALTEACALIAEADDKDAARTEVTEVLTRLLAGLQPRA